MPSQNQAIGSTAPKTATLQYEAYRRQGLPFIIRTEAGITSVGNRRIVTIQQDSNSVQYAVLGPIAYNPGSGAYTIIGWGMLEQSLQSGGISSIAPTPNVYVTGDTVTVISGFGVIGAIDYDTDNTPTKGISTARVDLQGRLTSVAADATHIQLGGAISSSVPGTQMNNQLPTGSYYYQMKDAVTP